jgi:D-serine dehydratase
MVCFLEKSGSLYNNHPSYSPNILLGIHTTKQQSIVDGCFLEKSGSLYNNHPSYSPNILLGIHTTKHQSLVDGLFFRAKGTFGLEIRESFS